MLTTCEPREGEYHLIQNLVISYKHGYILQLLRYLFCPAIGLLTVGHVEVPMTNWHLEGVAQSVLDVSSNVTMHEQSYARKNSGSGNWESYASHIIDIACIFSAAVWTWIASYRINHMASQPAWNGLYGVIWALICRGCQSVQNFQVFITSFQWVYSN